MADNGSIDWFNMLIPMKIYYTVRGYENYDREEAKITTSIILASLLKSVVTF